MKTSAVFDKHQQSAYDKMVSESGGIVWMNVGDGKTRVALLAATQIAARSFARVIIIVARRQAFYDWQQEIATLQLECTVTEIENYVYKEKEVGGWNLEIVLVSDGKLLNPVTQSTIESLVPHLGCVILDELWLYKNPKAQKHLAVREFTEDVPTIGISGSVMTARDIVDIYGQVAAVGRAQKLAPTLTKFRSKFQSGIQGNYFSWYPKPGAYQKIMELIAPFTYVYMPEIKRIESKTRIIKVLPTDYQRELIKELKETAAIEGKFELTNMANIITKAQQISNGWLKAENGDVDFFESNKVNRLVALVEELLQTEYKMVVWCAFREDIRRLKIELTTKIYNKIKIATLQSGEPFDIENWKRKDCRICLATEASGSSINHFAQVPYAIYFSQDCKFHSLQQSQGRHTRRSSEHNTVYNLFLHTENSLDSRVYYTVRTSQNSERSFTRQMDVLQWLNEK